MAWSHARRYGRVAAFLGFTAAVFASIRLVAAPAAGSTGHMDKLLSLNCKFVGAGTCGSASCHGGGNKETPPKKIGSEFSVWEAKDVHAKAATNLAKPNLKEHPWMGTIAGKLGITGDLAKSDRCVACHAANVPANLQGDKFAAAEGVSCYQCHGPAEKWLVPHATKGWTEGERKKMGHDALLKTHGLFDTKPVGPRADMCASCHLAIDEKLVQAGHPQPIFEQLTYQSAEPEHWIETNNGYGRLNLWAAGQIVGLRESVAQIAGRTDAALVAASKQQATAHLMMVQILVEANVVPGDAAKLKAAVDGPADAKAITDLTEPMLAAVNKLDAKGDKDKTLAVLKKLAALDPKAVNAAGRRGVEQVFFGLERLLLAYRDGANIAREAFTPVRASIKPLRDLKLYEKRFDTTAPDAKAVEASLPAAAKAIDGLK